MPEFTKKQLERLVLIATNPLESEIVALKARAELAESRYEYLKQFLFLTNDGEGDDYESAYAFDETIYFSRRKDETLEDVIDAAIRQEVIAERLRAVEERARLHPVDNDAVKVDDSEPF